MNLRLKRFSQDVDLARPDVIQYFLVFQKDDGGEVRLPVQRETTETLISLVYGGAQQAPVKPERAQQPRQQVPDDYRPEQDGEPPSVFPDDFHSEQEEYEEDSVEEDLPESEDEVPSL